MALQGGVGGRGSGPRLAARAAIAAQITVKPGSSSDRRSTPFLTRSATGVHELVSDQRLDMPGAEPVTMARGASPLSASSAWTVFREQPAKGRMP